MKAGDEPAFFFPYFVTIWEIILANWESEIFLK